MQIYMMFLQMFSNLSYALQLRQLISILLINSKLNIQSITVVQNLLNFNTFLLGAATYDLGDPGFRYRGPMLPIMFQLSTRQIGKHPSDTIGQMLWPKQGPTVLIMV